LQDCLFCKIVKKEIPAQIVSEDENILVFKDVNPQAPVHLLLIPKKHISSLLELQDDDADLAGKIQLTAARMAKEMGLAKTGFRLVCNCGRDSGQLVFHIHYHLLAGRAMNWPPG